ncbi:DEAD-box type RNA helicase [Saccharomyces pastorianus]|uniref:DEAD-box type RNA helicase n=1 Tax=Saccharomyces pastorianus TaxID=27292 RepID=A0A6C1ED23_SACPS|nr:DEAD-box type RNA helicase [Saccharomyces pastorianus]
MSSINPDNDNKDVASNTNVQLASVYIKAQSYIPQIEQVYQGTNPNIQEAKLLGELLQVLAEVPKGTHLFCDPILEPISIFSLTIFSFNEEATATWLKNHFDPILSVCDKCILNFARGKCKMLQHFAIQRHVPHEHVAKFNDIVCQCRGKEYFGQR